MGNVGTAASALDWNRVDRAAEPAAWSPSARAKAAVIFVMVGCDGDGKDPNYEK